MLVEGESVLSMQNYRYLSLLWHQWAGKLFNPLSTSNIFVFIS